MSPIPQKLIAKYSIRGQEVPRAGDRSFLTGSIQGGSRPHFTYTAAHPGFAKKGSTTEDLGAYPSAADEFSRFSHKKTLILAHFFYGKRACSECSHYKQCKIIFAAYV